MRCSFARDRRGAGHRADARAGREGWRPERRRPVQHATRDQRQAGRTVMNTMFGRIFLVGFTGLAGCAAAMPPQDLVTARASYARASHGPAATLDPAALHTANEALGTAEQAFAK